MIRIGRCICVGQTFLSVRFYLLRVVELSNVLRHHARQTGMSVLLLVMFYERSLSHINRELTDIGYIVANAFHVFGDKE